MVDYTLRIFCQAIGANCCGKSPVDFDLGRTKSGTQRGRRVSLRGVYRRWPATFKALNPRTTEEARGTNRPRIDDTMGCQNATKIKVRPALSRLNSRPYLPSLSPNTRYVVLHRGGKEGATPVSGISLSAFSQCTPPTHQLTRHEALAWSCYRSVEEMCRSCSRK